MKTSSKTPYEIRLELLQLAFEILAKQHTARAGAHQTHMEVPVVTTAPTIEEVIIEAEKMNAFISKANQSH